MRGLSFTADNELYAVDVTLVQKVARKLAITPVPSSPSEVVGIANLKGRVITVLSLGKILDNNKQCEAERYINTIVFKSLGGSEDQVGLAVERPGNLIEIDAGDIRPPPVTASQEGNFCISGVAETDGTFYRIIDIGSIQRKFIPGSDTYSGNSSFGGTESE
ncbi:MAG: chemotaxis protein CheW [Oscillospiraceae bacterium]|nr:chemotaxis protein CheW [Oscillospiraceae bacterium]